MNKNFNASIIDHFQSVSDPRCDRTKKHKLIDIIIITICAFIADAETFDDVEVFGRARIDWFKSFLELPNGIPSHDTFSRVFSRLDPKEMQEAFTRWTTALQKECDGRIIALDGKTVRRSFDKATGNTAIHLVSAWTSQNSLILGQVKTEKKSNEITAIPKLLEMLQIKNSIVSIDAMGCQVKIAEKIIEKNADYLLAVKGNQKNLEDDIHTVFELTKTKPGIIHSACQTTDKGHGRIEIRQCQVVNELNWAPATQRWPKAKCIAKVTSTRIIEEKESVESRYYISSMEPDAEKILHAVREHWGIENKAHWVLDVSFNEDKSRIRKDYAPENIALVRRIALNLLKQDTSSKHSLKGKRKKAAWDNDFLIKVLLGI